MSVLEGGVWLTFFLAGACVAFLLGYSLGLRALAWWKLNQFRDIENLIGVVREVAAATEDKRVDPVVVVDKLTQMKRSLNLPAAVEAREERFVN